MTCDFRYGSGRSGDAADKVVSKDAALSVCFVLVLVLALVSVGFGLTGCDAGSSASSGEVSREAGYDRGALAQPEFRARRASAPNDAVIDISSTAQGYVAVSAMGESRLKLLVTKGDMSYNYDMPGDGEPLFAPLNMGDGSYVFRIMLNTSGNSYTSLADERVNVQLESEFAPFLVSSSYCTFNKKSACVAKANELVAGAQNEEEAVRRVYTWIVDNIDYDQDKAAQLVDATGYVPDPDATFAAGKGVCFDYASLGAAMLRSQGIPCKIVTGYVSPDSMYHAWIKAYVDSDWQESPRGEHRDEWTRIDLTFAASGAGEFVGDGKTYEERFTY